MSIHMLNRAWSLTGLTATEKLVLLALADHADDDGLAFPGQSRLAQRTCLKERAIRQTIKRLVFRGLVTREPRYREGTEKGGRTSDLYRLTLPAPDAAKGGYLPAPDAAKGGYLPASHDTLPASRAAESSVEPSVKKEKTASASPSRATPAHEGDESKTKTPRKSATTIPADFRPDAASIAWIKAYGVTLEQAEPAIIEFVEYWQNRSKRYVDWQTAFRRNPKVESSLLRIAKAQAAPSASPSAWPAQQPERTAPYHHVLTPEELAAL